jgi:hypothetical protein
MEKRRVSQVREVVQEQERSCTGPDLNDGIKNVSGSGVLDELWATLDEVGRTLPKVGSRNGLRFKGVAARLAERPVKLLAATVCIWMDSTCSDG